MQRAIITKDGYLFLELLDGSEMWSDGDMTLSFSALRRDAIAMIDDVDQISPLRARVASVRAAMLVNC